MKKALTILVMVAFACSEPLEVIPYDYTKIFTGSEKKGWNLRSFQYTEEGKAPQGGAVSQCLADDIYIFYANQERRMEVLNGDTKCTPGPGEDPEPDMLAEGNWGFSNSGATLTIPFPRFASVPLPFVVRSVDEEKMTIEFFFEDNSSYRFNFRSADLE